MKKQLNACLLGLALAAFLGACQAPDKAKITGNLADVTDSSVVTLTKLRIDREELVDTLALKGGKFTRTLTLADKQPGFFYLYEGGKRLAALIVQPGDVIQVRRNARGEVSYKGSEETELYAQVEERRKRTVAVFDSLMGTYHIEEGQPLPDALNIELGKAYVRHKQDAIRFLFAHPHSLANVSLLYQRLPGDLPVFGHETDYLFFKTAYDSLATVWPQSAYVKALKEVYDRSEQTRQLQLALDEAQRNAVGFPDIALPDRKAQKVALSSLVGKTIVVSFWHSQSVDLRLDNQDLMALYKQYQPKGLEIYQISLDTDKAAWASAVAEQGLPWISVCDGLGTACPALPLYQVTEIPAFFVIGKDGNILARTGNKEELKKLLAQHCK